MWRAGAFRVILSELASVFSPTAVPPLAMHAVLLALQVRSSLLRSLAAPERSC
jgi:hypothetical protein